MARMTKADDIRAGIEPSVLGFLSTCIAPSRLLDDDGIAASDLQISYETWCAERHETAVSFWRMRDILRDVLRVRYERRGRRMRWIGLSFIVWH